jgi:hypothetical protein
MTPPATLIPPATEAPPAAAPRPAGAPRPAAGYGCGQARLPLRSHQSQNQEG